MSKKISRNTPCPCGSGKKYKNCCINSDGDFPKTTTSVDISVRPKGAECKENGTLKRSVPAHIKCPDYHTISRSKPAFEDGPFLTNEEMNQMRQTCRAARRVLNKGLKAVQPGVTTDYIDSVVHQACIDEGGYPSPLNYHGFPKSVCTSVNEVVCHGIPDHRVLQDGDIVNVDVTIFLNGVHGDCSETVAVGQIDEASRRLLIVTHESMMRGIAAVRQGGLIREIGHAIDKYVKEYGFSVVRDYCGHGIGKLFHTSPTVPHHYDPKECTKIRPGMIFTVEPMINRGTWECVTQKDGWTVVTRDRQRSAQFEHTILVTQDDVEILTVSE